MKVAAVVAVLPALMLMAMLHPSPGTGAVAAGSGGPRSARPASPDDHRVTVSAAQAQCRAEPSARAATIVRLTRGAHLEVLERRGNWVKVGPTGEDCWVADAQLDTTAIADAAPSTLYAPSLGGSAPVRRRSVVPRVRRPALSYGDGSCPCGSGKICVGPRGGRYCITSGGNKRYGM